jgi:hypothetical protein
LVGNELIGFGKEELFKIVRHLMFLLVRQFLQQKLIFKS